MVTRSTRDVSRSRRPPMVSPVHVVGAAATPFHPEQDAMLDELVFDAVYGALRECGLRKQDLGLSVIASMDVLDGRSISNGLTNAAAGGYLRDAFRVEGDSGVAVIAAAEAVASGDVEVAVAVGVHNPETTGEPAHRRGFLEQISNLGFEPHFDRPIGMSAHTTYGLQAAHHLQTTGADARALAVLAAKEINRGADRDRSVRRQPITADDVLASAPVSWPLHELMLPADSTGAVAVVLASQARAGRCTGRDARLTGFGHATGGYTWDGAWLQDPGAVTRRAARQAYRQAGIEPAHVELVELTAATPALHALYVDALGVGSARVNESGGVRSNYPGLANGAVRLLEVLDAVGSGAAERPAVSHSCDAETGLVAEDTTVIVVEAA